jgi:hypothetical protein
MFPDDGPTPTTSPRRLFVDDGPPRPVPPRPQPRRAATPKTAGPRTQPPPTTRAATSAYHVGQKVDVFWGSKWWPSTVVEVKDERYRIHYDGWSDTSDEWVGPDRVRPK